MILCRKKLKKLEFGCADRREREGTAGRRKKSSR